MRCLVLLAVCIGLTLASCSEDAGVGEFGGPPTLVAESPVRPYPDAASVRLYVEGELSEDNLEPGFLEPDGRVLSPEQRSAFEGMLSAASYRSSGTEEATACFIPHHFVKYYDEGGQEIGQISVCFCCTGIQAAPALGLERANGADYVDLEFDEAALRTFIEDLGLPADINCGD